MNENIKAKVIAHLTNAKNELSKEIASFVGFGLLEDADNVNRIHDTIEDTISELKYFKTMSEV